MYLNVGFKILTAVIMQSSVFWDVTPCSPLEVNRHFRGTAGSKFNNQACYLFHAGFLLSLFFDPEGGGDISLRNFG
jgi:hypothetical protein